MSQFAFQNIYIEFLLLYANCMQYKPHDVKLNIKIGLEELLFYRFKLLFYILCDANIRH